MVCRFRVTREKAKKGSNGHGCVTDRHVENIECFLSTCLCARHVHHQLPAANSWPHVGYETQPPPVPRINLHLGAGTIEAILLARRWTDDGESGLAEVLEVNCWRHDRAGCDCRRNRSNAESSGKPLGGVRLSRRRSARKRRLKLLSALVAAHCDPPDLQRNRAAANPCSKWHVRAG